MGRTTPPKSVWPRSSVRQGFHFGLPLHPLPHPHRLRPASHQRHIFLRHIGRGHTMLKGSLSNVLVEALLTNPKQEGLIMFELISKSLLLNRNISSSTFNRSTFSACNSASKAATLFFALLASVLTWRYFSSKDSIASKVAFNELEDSSNSLFNLATTLVEFLSNSSLNVGLTTSNQLSISTSPTTKLFMDVATIMLSSSGVRAIWIPERFEDASPTFRGRTKMTPLVPQVGVEAL